MNRTRSSRRSLSVLPATSVQKRRNCGSTWRASTSTRRLFTAGNGRYSLDTTAASTTPPSSAVKRSRSPPTAAILTSAGGTLADTGAARGRGDGAVDAFVAVDLTRQQRLHSDRVVLDVEHVDLEPLALGKAAFRRHQKKAGIGLGHDHGLPPRLEALRLRRQRQQRRGGDDAAQPHQRHHAFAPLLDQRLTPGPPVGSPRLLA